VFAEALPAGMLRSAYERSAMYISIGAVILILILLVIFVF
jgi:hypothetical protein